MSNPWDPQGLWPFLFKVWTDETKTSLVGQVTSVGRLYQHLVCMEPFEHQITIELSDPAADAITKGQYYECYIGDDAYVQANGSQQMRANGYIQSIQRSVAVPGGYDITGASAAIKLSDLHSGGNTIYNPHIFSSIIDVLNGVQSPAGSGQYPPGYRGTLTDSGRVAVWKDNKTPAASTTSQGTGNTTGATTLQVASTTGMTAGNWLQVNGRLSFTITGIVDGTHLGIYPPLNATVPAGQTVVDLGYKPVGLGIKWKSQWAAALLDLTTLCSDLGVLWCDTQGATARSGDIYVGPMNDPSGLTAWGGEPLRQDLATNHGINLEEVNSGFAQQYGYAEIDTIAFTEDFSHVKNVYWLTGHGGPDHGGITLQSLVGGPPFTSSSGSPSSPINGWSTYQPYAGGRLYFVKPCSVVTYDGSNFEFIAWQRMGTALFQYGVVNRGSSVGTNNPPPFGVAEDFLHARNITSADWLLAAGIGHLMWNSNPVPSYEITVRHPLTAGAVPLLPRPGQTVTINYSGVVEALAYDTNLASATYGQIISAGTVTILNYPPTGMSTSDPRYKKLQRAVEIEEEWTPDGEYAQTLSMGRGKWKSHYFAEQQAREMETAVHNQGHPVQSHFIKKPLWGTAWLLSQGTQGATTGWAIEDQNNRQLTLQPSSLALLDAQDTNFFDDSHWVGATLQFNDTHGWLDFVFCFPLGSSPNNGLNVGSLYAGFRLAGSNSGKQTKFYTTTDGITITPHGGVHPHGLLDANHCLPTTGTLRLVFHWHQGVFRAMLDDLSQGSTHHEKQIASWADVSTVLSTFGTIGFAYNTASGTQPLYLNKVHAQALAHVTPLREGTGPGHINPTSPAAKVTTQTAAQYGKGAGGWNGTGRAAGTYIGN